MKAIWKLEKPRADVAVLSGDLGSWTLEIARLLSSDSCSAPSLAVDKVLAAADELQAYFRGYFVFAFSHHEAAAARQPRVKVSSRPACEWKLCCGKKQMVIRWWGVLAQVFTFSDALFCCSWTSSSNVSPALLRVAVAAVITQQWQIMKGLWPSSRGEITAGYWATMWVKSDHEFTELTIFSRNEKIAACSCDISAG